MNLYDAYMTPRDRASCPLDEVLAVAARPRPTPPPPQQPPQPMPPAPPATGAACGNGGPGCDHYPSLAMVYAPTQCFRNMYEPAEGLSRGTIFAELDKPLGKGGRR